MKKNYVIINIETNGYFNRNDDKQIIFIEALKVDKNLNKISEFKTYIKTEKKLTDDVSFLTGITNDMLDSGKIEKEVLIDLIKFCEDSGIITHNAKFELSFILKDLYKNKIKDSFKFKYIDIKDLFKEKENEIGKFTWSNIKKYYNLNSGNDIDNILEIINLYLKDYNIDNLDDLFFIQTFHGKVFRGLNYAKYMCDILINNNKYLGYIVDLSCDKYVSYYAFLKELNREYFSVDEIEMLKKKGALVIMNVGKLCDESMLFTDYYSVQAVGNGKVTNDCYDLINGISKFVQKKKKNNDLKLVLWGNIDCLKEEYKIIDKNILDEFISFIDVIKEPWSNWSKDELSML